MLAPNSDFGNETQAAKGGDQDRLLGGDDQIAGQGEGQANAGGGPIDGGDECLVGRGYRPDHAAELTADPAPGIGGISGLGRVLNLRGCGFDQLEVTAAEKAGSWPVRITARSWGSGGELGEGILKLDDYGRGQRVESLRIVEGDQGVGVVALDGYE